MVYYVHDLGEGSIEQDEIPSREFAPEGALVFDSKIDADAEVLKIQEKYISEMEMLLIPSEEDDVMELTPVQMDEIEQKDRISKIRSLTVSARGTELEPLIEKIFLRYKFEIDLYERINSKVFAEALENTASYTGTDELEIAMKNYLNAPTPKGPTLKEVILYKIT